jgi:NAD(P)H-flavin reductase
MCKITNERTKYTDYENPAINSVGALAEKDANGYFMMKLIKKDKVTHDTFRFEFQHPEANMSHGLWPGGHYMMVVKGENGNEITHPYTPVSLLD